MSGMEGLGISALTGMVPALSGGMSSLMAPLFGGGAAAGSGAMGSLLGSGLTGALGSGAASMAPSFGSQLFKGGLTGAMGGGLQLLGSGNRGGNMTMPDVGALAPINLQAPPPIAFGNTGIMGGTAPTPLFSDMTGRRRFYS